MSIWKEIKKSINSDLNVPLNELKMFPKSIIRSKNVFLTLNQEINVGNVEQKVIDHDIQFFCKGTINVRAEYDVGITSTSYNRGEFYIKINGNVVATEPLNTKQVTTSNASLERTIDINFGDILSCSAFINEHATKNKIYDVAIRADIVFDDTVIEVLES